MRGAANVLTAGFVIGMARSIMIVLEKGEIVDTFVYYMGQMLEGKGPAFTILLLFVFVTILNFNSVMDLRTTYGRQARWYLASCAA